MIGILLSAAVAAAQLPAGFPKYEVDARCAAWAGQNAGGSDEARKVCVMTNQDAYDYSRAVWSSASPDLQAKCRGLADQQPHLPYEALANCLDKLLPADELRRQGPFRY